MRVVLAQIIPDSGIVQLYDYTSTFVEVKNNQPSDFILHQNYPNPFNPTTTISYELLNSGYVSINLYDILGNKIRELIASEKPAGNHSFVFDASSLASGVYTYVLNFQGKYQSKKIMLIK